MEKITAQILWEFCIQYESPPKKKNLPEAHRSKQLFLNKLLQVEQMAQCLLQVGEILQPIPAYRLLF